MIKVYGTNCPKCVTIMSKLKDKGLEFEKETDMEKIIEIGRNNKISSMPIVEWDGEILDFANTIKKLNTI